VSDRPEIQAAEQIGELLKAFPANKRGRILRRAIDSLDPKRATEEPLPLPKNNHCAHCAKPFRRRSYNQRFCGYGCSRDANAQRRIATNALQFELQYGQAKSG
jgi:hypothetical protein